MLLFYPVEFRAPNSFHEQSTRSVKIVYLFLHTHTHTLLCVCANLQSPAAAAAEKKTTFILTGKKTELSNNIKVKCCKQVWRLLRLSSSFCVSARHTFRCGLEKKQKTI